VNTTGIKNIDSIQTGELCKEAMFFAKDQLKNNGYFISKIFMGGTFQRNSRRRKKIF
jgi:23S rRNA (uridine2552-2'-O)-methyltransferase